jgi:hypothetical protein
MIGFHWFTRDWWRYLLAPRMWNAPRWPSVIWCRLRGHPEGVWWFNPGGWEPDMHCKNCGDDIG